MLLRAAILEATIEQLLGPVERRKGPRAGTHALADEDEGYDDPKRVHKDKVSPVVGCLGPRVGETQHRLVKQARGVVEDVSVELAERHDDLERVPERMVDGNKSSREEGERAPSDLTCQQPCDTAGGNDLLP